MSIKTIILLASLAITASAAPYKLAPRQSLDNAPQCAAQCLQFKLSELGGAFAVHLLALADGLLMLYSPPHLSPVPLDVVMLVVYGMRAVRRTRFSINIIVTSTIWNSDLRVLLLHRR
jgi:hypothetical protein